MQEMSADPDQRTEDAGAEQTEAALDERLPESTPTAVDSTVGTGSFFGIGCTVLTFVVVLLGIIIFVLR